MQPVMQISTAAAQVAPIVQWLTTTKFTMAWEMQQGLPPGLILVRRYAVRPTFR